MTTKLVAHRGFMAKYPENSLIGIEAALKAGACMVEFDVQMNAGEDLFVIHDADLKRTAGLKKSVFDLSTEQLTGISIHEARRFKQQFVPEPIPLLTDVLTLMGHYPERHALVEIKEESINHWGLEKVMQRLLAALENHRDQCVVISFDHKAVAYTQQHSKLATGWVVHRYNKKYQRLAEQLTPDYLICNVTKIPDKGSLWPGNWRWMLYDITKVADVLELAQCDIAFIETADIGGLLADTALKNYGC
ncbi:MAG: glycerophosphodiester phosphodiesterase family protein [Gammaproteobacteria bacterium]